MTVENELGPYIEHDNLSIAWGRALEHCLKHGRESVPLMVSITGFDNGVPLETPAIRTALDKVVKSRGGWSIETVANTIFPINQWNPQLPRSELFKRYERTYKKLLKMKETKSGTYFGRMVARGAVPRNQLDAVLTSYNERSKRRSKLQIGIFDATLDHKNQPFQGFPCLQQVAFSPHKDGKGLAVIGFYAFQYMLQRAYGNYLGLCRLGKFVAHELNRELVRVTCVAGVAQAETTVKKDKRSINMADLNHLRKIVKTAAGNSEE